MNKMNNSTQIALSAEAMELRCHDSETT